MDRETLKALQAPLKERYQTDPSSAVATMHAVGTVIFDPPGCRVDMLQNNGREIIAGLHPFAGGDGSMACSGDLLLQALVTCAGTTLAAVTISMGLDVTAATIRATGKMDFRGTLAVERSAPVGMTTISLQFDLIGTATDEQIAKLIQLTERYCVVYQTLKAGVAIQSCHSRL